jgi:bifunctional UDP-N-acetylglucosamine pyrophosphorylase/glucosamine-1-phosphate N-acetyltransferase
MHTVQPIILAAGKGTRFVGYDHPKVLAEFRGRPLLDYVLKAYEATDFAQPIVVVGYKAEEVVDFVGRRATTVLQKELLGTANAVEAALPSVPRECETVIVTYGDMPFITPATLAKLALQHSDTHATITATTVMFDDPDLFSYGRIIRDENGKFTKIVEQAMANPEIRSIKENNVGLYAIDKQWLTEHIRQIRLNKKDEYFITDIIEIAVRNKVGVETITVADWHDALGINTPEQLKLAEEVIPKE